MSGLDETLRQRVAANVGEPASIPPATDSLPEPEMPRCDCDPAAHLDLHRPGCATRAAQVPDA